MPLRRRGKEVDWQAELAAGPVSPASPGGPASRRSSKWGQRITTILWRAVRPAVGLVAFGATLIGRHHLAGVILIAVWVCLWPIDMLAARRRKRAREAAEQPSVEQLLQWELRAISRELRWIIDNPPERSIYGSWLDGATHKLQRLSADVAERWARPDLGRRCSGTHVSAAELDARRARLLELYGQVAPPEKLELVRSELTQAPSARAMTSS